MPKQRDVVERFWEKVDKRAGGCWIWTAGQQHDGYGNFRAGPRGSVRAHRFSWELARGPIPDGLYVCHRCDNPSCVNPDHLWLGSQKDNMRDMVAKGREAHLNGQKHGGARLTDDQAAEIHRLYRSGEHSHKRLAAMFGVSKAVVGNMLRGYSWRHVGPVPADVLASRRTPRGSQNARAKLTEVAVRDIRMRYGAGVATQYQLATEYGVSQTMISYVVRHKTWRHVA